MPMYDNSNRRYDSDELDPCLAAEVRIKNDLLDIRQSKCLLCFILTLLTLMLLVAAFIMLFYGGSMSDSVSRIRYIKDNDVSVLPLRAQSETSSPSTDTPQTSATKLMRTKVGERARIKNGDNVYYSTATQKTVNPTKISRLQPPKEIEYRINQQFSSTAKTSSTVSSTLPKILTQITTTTMTAPLPFSTTWYNVYVTVTESTSSSTSPSTILPKTKVNLANDADVAKNNEMMDATISSVQDHSMPDLISIISVANSTEKYQYISTSESKEHCGRYLQDGYTASGVYKISVHGVGDFKALCIMNSDDAWTVLQRRVGGELPFWNATFEEYASGFGDPRGDHWLGLEKVHGFVHRNYDLQLRIILQGDLCVKRSKCGGLGQHGYWWGDWDFSISSRANLYKLTTLKYLRGNLSHPNNDHFMMLNKDQYFTTVDSDNDASQDKNIAAYLKKGGWWHKDFSFVALNGEYGFKSSAGTGQSWYWSNGKGETYYIKPKASLMMFRLKK